jgi:hypothetical protein
MPSASLYFSWYCPAFPTCSQVHASATVLPPLLQPAQQQAQEGQEPLHARQQVDGSTYEGPEEPEQQQAQQQQAQASDAPIPMEGVESAVPAQASPLPPSAPQPPEAVPAAAAAATAPVDAPVSSAAAEVVTPTISGDPHAAQDPSASVTAGGLLGPAGQAAGAAAPEGQEVQQQQQQGLGTTEASAGGSAAAMQGAMADGGHVPNSSSIWAHLPLLVPGAQPLLGLGGSIGPLGTEAAAPNMAPSGTEAAAPNMAPSGTEAAALNMAPPGTEAAALNVPISTAHPLDRMGGAN